MVGGRNQDLLSTQLQVDTDHSMAWDSVKRVRFTMPFPDTAPDIWFDELLPRIVHLAESSPERRTKIDACELLHALIVYMIGRNAQDPSARKKDGGESQGTLRARSEPGCVVS